MKIKLACVLSLLLFGFTGKSAEPTPDPIAAFAQKWFAVDLGQQNFGASIETFPDLQKGWQTEWMGKSVTWGSLTNHLAKDTTPIAFGFSNNQLVAIQVHTALKKSQADQVMADFIKMSETDPKGKSKYRFQTVKYQVSYEGLCSPAENAFGRVTFGIRETK